MSVFSSKRNVVSSANLNNIFITDKGFKSLVITMYKVGPRPTGGTQELASHFIDNRRTCILVTVYHLDERSEKRAVAVSVRSFVCSCVNENRQPPAVDVNSLTPVFRIDFFSFLFFSEKARRPIMYCGWQPTVKIS